MRTRKLYRNKRDGMLGGVCSGLSDYFEIDVSLIRVLFILAMILGGGGLIAYLVLWIIIPENTIYTPEYQEVRNEPEFLSESKQGNTNIILGIILILIGLFFVFERFFRMVSLHRYWPVILILAGVVVILFSLQKTNHHE
ncbi:MAG: PspC domain-containing protein [Sphingobacteriales bacterium]|nr:PspC domain-containing protein [Sphingobacteriales bacterium]